jgi:hypothetical protein
MISIFSFIAVAASEADPAPQFHRGGERFIGAGGWRALQTVRQAKRSQSIALQEHRDSIT